MDGGIRFDPWPDPFLMREGLENSAYNLLKGLFPFILSFLFVICGKTVKSMILILAEFMSVV
jgi:hypothetical protein